MNEREIKEAARRFQEFHDEEAEFLTSEEFPETAFIVGEVDGITYTIIEDGKETTYHHDFTDRPTLAVSHDGRVFYGLRGDYKFTERGFEG